MAKCYDVLNGVSSTDALISVVDSVASEESAMADLMIAETEKLHHALEPARNTPLDVLMQYNDSFQETARLLTCIDCKLSNKLTLSLDALTGATVCPAPATTPIPGVSIQTRYDKTKYRWLVAHIYGQPQSGDRLYLRHYNTSRDGEYGWYKKRVGHPVDPNGNDPSHEHLQNRAYFHGDGYMQVKIPIEPDSIDPSDRALPTQDYPPVQTEWPLTKPNEFLWLMPLADFWYYWAHGQGSNQSIMLDFAVARPDTARQAITYGPPSRLIRFKAQIDYHHVEGAYLEDGHFWKLLIF
ncbi:hypothetical protein AGMMS49992_15000 [Clostridia bacterium]|nr:hypothetical protein AGMMS49992_15000 [Clostridia bacterium]